MSTAPSFELIGGHPVLDLVNTVSWRGDAARRTERIPGFDALLEWLVRAGVANADERGRLADSTRDAPEPAVRALAGTRRLREGLHDALTTDGRRRTEAIDLLWPQLTTAVSRTRPEGLPVRATIDLLEPGDVPRKLAVLAFEFLGSSDMRRVGRCADPACGWLFLDRSRGLTRRWCSSSDCGNRNRVRRYYARQAHP